MAELLTLLLTGAAGAAAIKLLDNIIMWTLGRRAKKQDGAEEAKAAAAAQMQALTDGQRVILLDRLQYLCRCYIRDGAVDFDDRRRLHKMHDVYHALGGNGDLNTLMEAVDELPVK